jgi:hypothetical protein
MTATFLRRTTFVLLGIFTIATIYVHEGWLLKPADPEWAHIAPFRWWLIPHVATGIVAFLIAPLQFSASIRRRWLGLHRWLGRTYVFATLIASGAALYIGMFHSGSGQQGGHERHGGTMADNDPVRLVRGTAGRPATASAMGDAQLRPDAHFRDHPLHPGRHAARPRLFQYDRAVLGIRGRIASDPRPGRKWQGGVALAPEPC